MFQGSKVLQCMCLPDLNWTCPSETLRSNYEMLHCPQRKTDLQRMIREVSYLL